MGIVSSTIQRLKVFGQRTLAKSVELNAEFDQLISSVNNIVADLSAMDTSGGGALATHKTSTDHDGRYYTEAEIDAVIGALKGVGYTDQTLKGLSDIDVSLQAQITNILATYSTDAERIQAFNDVVSQFENADQNIINMINNKANTADVYTKTQTDALAWNTSNLVDRAVTSIKLALLSVGAEHIKNGAVGADQLHPSLLENVLIAQHRGLSVLDHPDGSVTTAKIANGAVTTDKLDASVATAIANATIMTDRTTAQKYRFYMDNGNLFVEEVV